MAGIIGSDGMGDWLEAKLQQMNVDTGGLVREGERPTTVKTRIVHGSTLLWPSRSAIRPCTIANAALPRR